MSEKRNAIYIRWMIRRDMPEIMDIEDDSFEFPWRLGNEKEGRPPKGSFLAILSERNAIGMVAEIDGRIAGYMVYVLHESRIELLNFAVRRDVRRQGVGRAMIDKLRATLSRRCGKWLVVFTDENNLPAQLFFRAVGMRATGIEIGSWPKEGRNAIRFVCRSREPAAVKEALS